MFYNRFLFAAILSLSLSTLYAQDKILIRGKVLDATNNKPIAFSSVMVESQKKGTITDALGHFLLRFSRLYKKDTLVISFLGYENVKMPIYKGVGFINVALEPKTTVLDDVIVTPFKPTYYIDEAMKRVHENYDYKPYYIISYFENNLYEDKHLLMGAKSVFKTYYKEDEANPKNEPRQEHQLLLYEDRKDTHELKFMEKELKEVMKDEQTDEEGADNEDFKIRMTPMYVPLQHLSLPFLDKEYYKKFVYTLRETCNNRDLIIIDFKTKRKFSYSQIKFKGGGTIYMDCRNYAIVKLDMDFDIKLSFLLKSILFIGFKKMKLHDIDLRGSIEYKLIEDFWYPSTLTLSGRAKAEKFRWFSKNDKAEFGFSSTTLSHKIITTDVVPIPRKKQFSFREINLQNDMGMSWDDVITVKHHLYEGLGGQ